MIFFYFRNDREELPINIFTTTQKKHMEKNLLKSIYF